MVGHGIEIGFSGCKWRCRAAQKTGKTCFITGIYHLCGSLNTEHLRRLKDPPKGQIFVREETDTVPRRIPQRGTAEIRFCDVTVSGHRHQAADTLQNYGSKVAVIYVILGSKTSLILLIFCEFDPLNRFIILKLLLTCFLRAYTFTRRQLSISRRVQASFGFGTKYIINRELSKN